MIFSSIDRPVLIGNMLTSNAFKKDHRIRLQITNDGISRRLLRPGLLISIFSY
jgi:predicted acyl esterase